MGKLEAQAPVTPVHEHVAVPASMPLEKRPEFGCFSVSTSKELRFRQSDV